MLHLIERIQKKSLAYEFTSFIFIIFFLLFLILTFHSLRFFLCAFYKEYFSFYIFATSCHLLRSAFLLSKIIKKKKYSDGCDPSSDESSSYRRHSTFHNIFTFRPIFFSGSSFSFFLMLVPTLRMVLMSKNCIGIKSDWIIFRESKEESGKGEKAFDSLLSTSFPFVHFDRFAKGNEENKNSIGGCTKVDEFDWKTTKFLFFYYFLHLVCSSSIRRWITK